MAEIKKDNMNQFDNLKTTKRIFPEIIYINDLGDIELFEEKRAEAVRTQSITNAFLTELDGISTDQNIGTKK